MRIFDIEKQNLFISRQISQLYKNETFKVPIGAGVMGGLHPWNGRQRFELLRNQYL